MDDPQVFTEFNAGSGLRVLHQFRDLSWFGCRLIVWAGHRHTPRGKEELAHLTEHLLGCATHGYAYQGEIELETAIEMRGWEFNQGESALDSTHFELFADVPSLDEALEFLEAYVRRPKLRFGIREQLKIIARERIYRSDEDSRLGAESLYMALYRDAHFAQVPGWSDRADLSALTMEDVRRFHRDWYDCPNMTMIVAGGIPEDRLRAVVERRFPVRNPHYAIPPCVETVRIRRPERRMHDMRPARGAKHAVTITSHWLLPPGMGDGLGLALHILRAELTKELRTKLNETYDVAIECELYRDHRTVSLSLSTIPEAMHLVRRTINAILRDEERLLRDLHYYKRTYEGSMRFDDSTVAEALNEAHDAIIACGAVRSYAARRKSVQAVTAQDLLRWLREWLTPERAFTELSGH